LSSESRIFQKSLKNTTAAAATIKEKKKSLRAINFCSFQEYSNNLAGIALSQSIFPIFFSNETIPQSHHFVMMELA
jgi:hypothetical protein